MPARNNLLCLSCALLLVWIGTFAVRWLNASTRSNPPNSSIFADRIRRLGLSGTLFVAALTADKLTSGRSILAINMSNGKWATVVDGGVSQVSASRTGGKLLEGPYLGGISKRPYPLLLMDLYGRKLAEATISKDVHLINTNLSEDTKYASYSEQIGSPYGKMPRTRIGLVHWPDGAQRTIGLPFYGIVSAWDPIDNELLWLYSYEGGEYMKWRFRTWTLNIGTRAIRRRFAGELPAPSPDGKSVAVGDEDRIKVYSVARNRVSWTGPVIRFPWQILWLDSQHIAVLYGTDTRYVAVFGREQAPVVIGKFAHGSSMGYSVRSVVASATAGLRQ